MGATSPEEIQRQHNEAMKIVHNSNDDDSHNRKNNCPIIIPKTIKSEIPLSWKQIPTVDDPYYNSNNTHNNNNNNDTNNDTNTSIDVLEEKKEEDYQYSIGSCIATRGIINVDDIASIIQEGCQLPSQPLTSKQKQNQKQKPPPSETNLWHESNAKKYNVHITRPSHDAWGIQKIILLFCDDFLQTVYEMPYFTSPKYVKLQQSLQSIYDVLNIQTDRIVRMLFASLPAGVTIPVHHDTGEWVKHTHRVHVPIIVDNPNHILFRCGPTEDTLQRVDCTPGHIFEMNNQAKHTVSNCSSTSNTRVHLILDYVDDDFVIKNRVKLHAGETIIQSRRSIDRAIDAGKRQTPSFMILGAQKCGTTSLYEYINQHPLVIRPKRRETHCFDWRWDPKLTTKEKQKEHCMSFFHAKELHLYPSLQTGDSTPSYLLDSYRVIPRVKNVLYHKEHWKKIALIVMLRNPTKRVQSHYEMVTSLDGTEAQIKARGTEWLSKSIEEVIEMDFKNMKGCGLIPYWDLEAKKIVDMDTFHSFAGSKEEDEAFQLYLKRHVAMNTGSHSILVRGMYELQLRQWMNAFDKKQFLVLKLESMSASSNDQGSGLHDVMNKVWKHLDLPCYKIQDEKAKNTRTYKSEMNPNTKEMLDRFYKPHNERLSLLLGDGDEWKGNPWESH